MKISQDLPQFKEENALLIVTGKHEADFFHASHGEIERIAGFKVEKPHYSDREGHFKTRGRGVTVASGAVYEAQKEKILQDFRREFRKALRLALGNNHPDVLYVYTPAYLKNEVYALLPKRIQSLVKKIFSINIYGRHPFEILERIRVRS